MGKPIRVLLVDDSVFLRHSLTRRLESVGADIEVIGAAADGLEALEKVAELQPDVVVLDVEMPRMDGLTALQRIMREHPTPVVMLSALTRRGARTTIQALVRGAVDFVAKPDASLDIKSVIEELVDKIRVAAATPLASLSTRVSLQEVVTQGQKLPTEPLAKEDPLVVIGSSTGGPRALQWILSDLPADLPAAVTIVQHMPAAFTSSLAERLNSHSSLMVQEAAFGNHLQRGLALLAPGDFHMQFGRRGRVVLDKGPKRNHLRPSVDVTMESAAEYYGAAVIGVVLTGMGSDGAEGAARIRAAGGRVIAEHESSSIVYGMPRSVVEAGQADYVVPLPKIASTLVRLVRNE